MLVLFFFNKGKRGEKYSMSSAVPEKSVKFFSFQMGLDTWMMEENYLMMILSISQQQVRISSGKLRCAERCNLHYVVYLLLFIVAKA